jgi:hypothetical protein
MRWEKIAFAIAVLTAATSASSEAGAYAHRHRYCGYGPHEDYTRSNSLSPLSYIYPAANWGPFFQCRMYSGPVYVDLHDPS